MFEDTKVLGGGCNSVCCSLAHYYTIHRDPHSTWTPINPFIHLPILLYTPAVLNNVSASLKTNFSRPTMYQPLNWDIWQSFPYSNVHILTFIQPGNNLNQLSSAKAILSQRVILPSKAKSSVIIRAQWLRIKKPEIESFTSRLRQSAYKMLAWSKLRCTIGSREIIIHH